jgi:hypothetical protein
METQTLTMAGFEPAIQPPRVCAAIDSSLADARDWMGGPSRAHGEEGNRPRQFNPKSL